MHSIFGGKISFLSIVGSSSHWEASLSTLYSLKLSSRISTQDYLGLHLGEVTIAKSRRSIERKELVHQFKLTLNVNAFLVDLRVELAAVGCVARGQDMQVAILPPTVRATKSGAIGMCARLWWHDIPLKFKFEIIGF